MKFATKLIAALWSGMCLIYAANAWDRFRREATTFESDMMRDHEVMGRGLGAAVAEVWEREGPERALELVERANQRESQILIRWVDPGSSDPNAPRPTAPTEAIAGVHQGEFAGWVDRTDEGRLYTYVPLRGSDRWLGAIELSESLAAERAYLRGSVTRMTLTFSLLTLTSGGVVLVVGIFFVARPIRALVDKARRVGAGDFEGPLVLRQRDELGQLADEMNAMSDRLSEARWALNAEMAARLEAIEQLRHGERLMTVGKLASGIAHELGTPLNVIGQRARMIASGEVEGADARESAATVAEYTDRITRIVRQLLAFARSRSPEVSPQDMRWMAENTLTMMAPLARKHRVQFSVEGDPGPVSALVDLVQIQQVLANLVLNGIQAMDQGGQLAIRVRRVEREPPAGVGGETRRWIAVSVRDEGCGIAPEHLDRVFDPFFTTKPVGEGTGLGLSVAWGIVREHHGWIAVESQPAAGATFTVYLPEATP